MFRFSFTVALVAAALAMPATTPAQQTPAPARDAARADTGRVHLLKLGDGTTLVGRVVRDEGDTVRFAARGATLAIPRADIAELREVPGATIRNGAYWPANAHATRLFFAPTGRMLPKGDGYFSDTYLFFLNGLVGVTDQVTLGGGMSIFPMSDFSENIFYLTPKVGLVATERFNAAVGALVGFTGLDDTEQFGIVYGVATTGTADHSLTAGAGVGYAGGGFASRPMLMLGGETRVGRRASLVTENYLFTGGDPTGLVSYGVRFFGEKLSVDLAFWNMPGEQLYFPGIPYVGFAVRF